MVRLDKTEKTLIAVWLVWILLALAFWGTVIFVGLHFVAKVW